MIMDSDYHGTRNREERVDTIVSIGENAWLATRVTVLRGSSIGENSVITAGSVVSGYIPANVVAGGVPARTLRRIEPGDDRTNLHVGYEATAIPPSVMPEQSHSDAAPVGMAHLSPRVGLRSEEDLASQVKQIVTETFALPATIDFCWGPGQIPQWTSMGHLRLAMALQDRFGIQLTADDLMQMTSVEKIYNVVRGSIAHDL
jgi:hypothetical protein